MEDTRPSSRRIGVVEDPRYREHRPPEGHPERPDRLVAVGEAVAARRDRLVALAPRPGTDDEILRVHDRDHLARVEEAARRAPSRLDPDTYASARSLEVARLAVGGAVDLARAVARGELDAGLAAVRPPGHHAEADRAMGFCLFNNAAVVARALQAEEGVGRLLLLDWDVHHGNGSQHSFYADPSVIYVSTHQFPYYPGTGDWNEVGAGRGEGTTLNVPMPPGCGDAEYLGVFERVVVPAIRAFEPELVLVSCGFDAHRDDPLASMELSGAGFREATRQIRAVADALCGGRLVFVLEGGYALSGLREGTGAVLDALLEQDCAPAPGPDARRGSTLHHLIERAASTHAARVPRIGQPS